MQASTNATGLTAADSAATNENDSVPTNPTTARPTTTDKERLRRAFHAASMSEATSKARAEETNTSRPQAAGRSQPRVAISGGRSGNVNGGRQGVFDASCTDSEVYQAHLPHNGKFPTIVRDKDGKWYEIHCKHCGNNSTDRGRKWVVGTLGFGNHMNKTHGLSSRDHGQSIHTYVTFVMANVVKREVDADELDQIKTDPEYEIVKRWRPSGIKHGPRNFKSKIQKCAENSNSQNRNRAARARLQQSPSPSSRPNVRKTARPHSERNLRPRGNI